MADATEPIVDATVVEDHPHHHDPEPAPVPTALVRRERRSEVIRPLNAAQLAESMEEYQALLPQLLTDSDYQATGFDKKTGKEKRFVKKSGWRKIAAAFDLDVILIENVVERDEHGNPLRARVTARAIAPSGRTMDGDGYCAVDEERFEKKGGKAKLENDLRGTATTRAKNRAISDLVGMGDVSAEEVSGNDLDGDGPPHGPAVDEGTGGNAKKALLVLCAGEVDRAKELWTKLEGMLGGYMPTAAALALLAAASTVTPQAAPPQERPQAAQEPTQAPPTPQAVGSRPGNESDPELAGLEDEAFELWAQIGTHNRAVKRVQECGGDKTRLRALIKSATDALAKRDAAANTEGAAA